ncbi:MAG: TetR/AcrR family transcriptional regulator [Actinomycetota bacterium]|nr:TetR/AcrR family transcriptional regulator [Actinomycetota bacterium]
MTRQSTTSVRIVVEALRLFAIHGYRGTRVSDIEGAAGLSPKAGGFYRHFRSKSEVLEAALHHYADQATRSEAALDLLPLSDFRSELTLLCRWVLNMMAEQRDFIRILHREGDEFPDLVAQFHERIVRRGLELATGFFRLKQKEAGLDLQDHDPEAIAAVALGSIINYRVEEAMFGEPPGPVSEERFIKTWVDVWSTYGNNLVRAGGSG